MTSGACSLPGPRGLPTDLAWPGLATGLAALRDALRDVVGVPAEAPQADVGTAAPVGPDRGDTGGDEAAREEAARAVWAVVQRAQAGDGDAFGELYDRYVDMVYRYVYYRVGSHALAEDLTSETFLRALRRLSSFTWQGRDFGAWLTTIARNLVLDHAKSGRARLETTASEVVERDRPDESAGSSPEEATLAAIASETLLAAVARLGDEQRECVVLRFLQGLSVAETAEVMGKNDGAVKALQYRAVRALARLLPPDLAP